MNDPKGSLWRKWDLHVHTPESIINNYSGNNPWERFLRDIEDLPPEFKVLGINDYIFLDGYKRILEERKKGRLANIELILPVIELRLDKFGGSPGHLKRVNYHVIFSDELSPELIEHQFLYALSSKYVLTPEYDKIRKNGSWHARPTRESLEDLGNKIIESAPPNERSKFNSPLIEGFNSLCISVDSIREVLKSHYFKDKVVTAVGKTEWADIKWNDQSIAEKKTIINDADLVFISAAIPEDWNKAKKRLSEEEVNNLLLDCSDAHTFSDASDKDRIGKCFTWIKADPTFRGLLQVKNEPNDRVFVGDTPPIHLRVRNNSTRYIKSIRINKKPESDCKETWFNNEIQLNSNLVAIIGNKGKGKSALTDIIGLLCNTRQDKDFTFLSNNNFRQSKENKAGHFKAELEWESGSTVIKGLDETVDKTKPELANYIPQNFLEKICTQIGEIDESDFDRELKKVIFSHVSNADRLGKDKLDDLIKYHTSEYDKKIRTLKEELHQINEQIEELEKQNQQEHKDKINNLLSQKKNEIEVHKKSKPVEVTKPENDLSKQKEISKTNEKINNLEKELPKIEVDIEEAIKEQNKQADLISITNKLIDRLDNLDRSVQNFKKDSEDELSKIGVPIESIVKISINRKPLDDKRKVFLEAKKKAEWALNKLRDGSPAYKKQSIESELKDLKNKLDEPNRKYQAYKADLISWTKQMKALEGDEMTPESLDYYQKQLDDIKKIPGKLDEKHSRRLKKSIEIHAVILQLVNIYRDLYKPVNNFVESSSLASGKFNLKFDVGIVATGFEKKFFEYISQGIIGTFYGIEEGHKMMEKLLKSQDFNTEKGIEDFLNKIIDYLQNDRRSEQDRKVSVTDQLRKEKNEVDLYDMIFSLEYLKPRYALKMGDKELSQLSPGERGTLLLVFYLLVDKEDIPLIIDQPEENLDNQTVYELLVPCIKEAKERRQIVIVTHNPNLAVVCDAEQIICADLNKKDNYKMQYYSGSIENPTINKRIVNILEGTMPAFDNRDSKYQK